MDDSFREQESDTQRNPTRFPVSQTILARIVQWLKGVIKLTEEEQEEAGIYLDRLGDE